MATYTSDRRTGRAAAPAQQRAADYHQSVRGRSAEFFDIVTLMSRIGFTGNGSSKPPLAWSAGRPVKPSAGIIRGLQVG